MYIDINNIDENNLDKKIFVNNIICLFIPSLIHINIFLLKTWKHVQYTIARYFAKTLFQFVRSLSKTDEHSRGKNCFLSKIELIFIDLENLTFCFPAFLLSFGWWHFQGCLKTIKLTFMFCVRNPNLGNVPLI